MAKHNYPSDRAHGGARPNAGRPASMTDPVYITVRIEQEDRDWLASQGLVSEVVRQIIKEARIKENFDD